MVEEPENLVLQQLRLIREETGEMRGDVRRMEAKLEAKFDALGVRIENLETQMIGISLMMTTLFGAVQNLDHRVERLETRVERIEDKIGA